MTARILRGGDFSSILAQSPKSFALPRQKNAANAAEQPASLDQMTEVAAEKKVPAKTSKKGTPVSSAELLQIVSEMEGETADKLAQACGYYTETTTTATGECEIRVTSQDQQAFMVALVASQGLKIAPPARSSRRTNRQPIIKIGKTGNIVVGGRYSTIAGFEFGEDIDSRVRVQAEKGKITIVAAYPEDYTSSDMEDDIDGIEESSDIDD